ncbi:hypothetical protein CBR_g66715 [Chara braunii]|uniref:RNA-directed DNA polymerase n=1 Tax=Chara braunii TaxID=69332 RepID=A0A388JQ46_CHABU|nr:hypothetical protein CBR_g66715 [Chara braunii]|eukprot:GBG59910.1 hypothetical protein CBR_g66715 [Chara braunii]
MDARFPHRSIAETALQRVQGTIAGYLHTAVPAPLMHRWMPASLGHVLDGDGIKPEESKIAAIRDWPTPRTLNELRSFLGLANYYRKFVRNFSTIAAPLRRLLKKEAIWQWDKDCTSALKKLKRALIEYPVLKVADSSLPFVVTTDASQYCIGAVLQQDDDNGYRPVEFISARMPSEKVATSTYERELYALRQALEHWKHYLLGRHFKVYSDHETLRWLKTQAKMTPKLTMWAAEIDQYDFELKPFKGKYNVVADALSRRSDYFGAIELTQLREQDADELRKLRNLNLRLEDDLNKLRADLVTSNKQLMLRRSNRIAAREGQAAVAEQQLPLPHPSEMDTQGNPTVDNAASGSPREVCSSNPSAPQAQQEGSSATSVDAAPVRQQGETMTAFLARLGTYMQQVQEEQQREAAAEAARRNAIARAEEQRRRQQADAAANHNRARRDAASVLMQQEASHTAALQAWYVDPAETTEPTTEDQTKSALASMMHQVILTCNWQQVELARQAHTIIEYEETLKSLHARLDMLEKDDRSVDALSTTIGERSLYTDLDQIVEKACEVIQINWWAANERRSQPNFVEKGKGPQPQQVAAVQGNGQENDQAMAHESSEGNGVNALPPRRNDNNKKKKAKSVSTTEAGQLNEPWKKFSLTEEQYKLRQRWNCCYWCNNTKHTTSQCPDTAKLGKLSFTGSEATPLPTPPDTVALPATSSMSGEHAYVASLREDYEDYAVQLVPPLDQPLHVQDSFACATSSSSPSEPASSPTSLRDSSVWSRLEELDPLTLEDFQWLPLPPSGSLPKSHCNALMEELRNYLHAVVPAPLMEDGVAVVDLREYIAKIDREYATQWHDDTNAPLLYIRIQIGKVTYSTLIYCGATRNYISQDFMTRADLGPRVRRKSQPTQVTEDHPVNFYRRTVHVRDRNGVLVPCMVPPPHPSIGCHVVSAASIHNSIARNDVEEMGICFLHALPCPHELAAEQPPDPRNVQLLDSYGDAFEAPTGIVPNRPIRHEIILEDGAVPPRGCVYRMSEEELEVLRTQLDDLIDKGWIRPSCSPYGAPVLFVRKKNKELRLCIDYRKLNAQTIKNVGPLPRIDDLLERLGGAKYFSKLDLKAGCHQLEIHPRDRYKTSFKTRYGHFEWVVMPFGLTNAPTTFQAAMTTEFRDMLDRFVLIYLDDILEYSRTLDEHIVHLHAVLDRLRTAKYKANGAKCECAQQELEHLGHFVTPQGIRPLADKIKAIQDWPEPTNTTEVRSFMGLVGHYQRFIEGYARIAAPLSRLQSPQDGAQLQQTATQQLQQRVCTTATTSSPEPRETAPKFDGQEIFHDSIKTDPIPLFRKFELALQLHNVKEHKHHAYLYSRSGGACQAWLDNLLSKYGVVANDLHTKITWDDLKAVWHKRFQVEPPEIKAMDKLMVFEQGTLPSTDWIAEYQRLTQGQTGKLSTAESDATTLSTPSQLVSSRVTNLHSEAHAEVDSPPLLFSFEDYAARLVPTLGTQAQGQGVCAVSSPSGNSDKLSSSGSSRDSAREFNVEALDPLTSGDFAWHPLPTTGCLPGPQCAALSAKLHTYLSFYAPPTLPTDDEVAVADILAYITKVAREFRTQRYDDNNAPLMYVRIHVGQASCSALLDSGASRNFMSQSFMQRAGLGAQVRRKANPTAIKLADGKTQQLLDRYIEAVPVYFAPHACEPVTFDILDTDFDIILGMPWLASADHTVNFHRRTLIVRDAFGAEVACTIPLPHSSIRCQVVTAKSFRATCTYEQPEEIGLCFLRTAAVADSSPTDLSSDPRVVRLLDEFADIFESPTGVVPGRPISHEIILEAGAVPPKGCIYRMSEEELEVLRAQLDDFLAKGWIRPSSSPYGAPVVFVRKKNKDLRLCTDYRKLNAQIVKNAGPLPRIDDLLKRLGGAKYFSKLDLKSGYYQVSIQPNNRYKTAFKTRYGHFEWVVMPFGLTNATTTFQAAMTNEFRAMLDRFVLVYLDDILIYSRTLEDPLGHLRRVLETLRRAKYKANRDKCEFVQQEMEYLGHFVTPEGISPLSDKIQAVQEWSEPRNVTDVRSFLVLEQHDGVDWHPVEYFSKKVPLVHSIDDVRKKELLAFVHVLKWWRHFLLGRSQFRWVTDNNPLVFYKTQDTVNSTIARWMAFIDQFDFFPDHILGKSNRFADALSRRPDHCTAIYLTFEIDDDQQNSFIRGYEADSDFRDKYVNCSSPNPAPSHYRIQEGYLLVHTRGKDLLCVSSDPHLRTRLLGEFHDAPATGHFVVNRTIGRLRQRFWWPGLLGDVTRYCESFEVCRRCKSRNHRPYGELRPLPVPLRRREAIAMDITGPFPKHKTGVYGILTVVDRLTKFAMFPPCRYHAKAPELAEVLYAGWIRTKGYPKEIVCDRDTRFMSDFWLALIKRCGSSLKPTDRDDFPGRRTQDPPSMDGFQEVGDIISQRRYGNKPTEYLVENLQDVNKRLQEYNTSLQQYNSKLQGDTVTAQEALAISQREKAAVMEEVGSCKGMNMALQSQLESAQRATDDLFRQQKVMQEETQRMQFEIQRLLEDRERKAEENNALALENARYKECTGKSAAELEQLSIREQALKVHSSTP